MLLYSCLNIQVSPVLISGVYTVSQEVNDIILMAVNTCLAVLQEKSLTSLPV